MIIKAEKEKTIIVIAKEDPPAPDISPLFKKSFEVVSANMMEQALTDKGIVIPGNTLKDIAPTYHKIGKEYYTAVNKFKEVQRK